MNRNGIKITLLILSFSLQTYSQNLSNEKAFFYLLKIYDKNVDDFINSYGFTFDKTDYNYSKSDEFARNTYRSKIRTRINDGINSISFNDKFTLYGTAELGEYNFDISFFPVKSWSWDLKLFFDSDNHNNFSFNIPSTNFINLKDFDGSLNMTNADANNFIKSRKKPDGEINRTVYLKITYSILNKTTNLRCSYCFLAYCYSIEFFSDMNCTKRIGSISPKIDYYDKVNGIIMKDGQEIIYFKSRSQAFWSSAAASIYKEGVLPSKVGAEFYRVLSYSDGKIVSLKDYYISGELEMEGTYQPYCVDDQCANGLFTWYYKNGIKRQESSIVNGTMDECVYQWLENGNCRDAYSNFMHNGNSTGENKKCPCISQNGKPLEKSQTNSSQTNIPLVKNNNEQKINGDLILITTELGIIKIKLYGQTPKHKANFIKLVNEGFYDGSVFHRVIKGFMVQGGGAPNGNSEVDYLIPAEIIPSYIHKKGALAAARNNNPKKESSGSQFYIVQGKVASEAELNQFDGKRTVKYTAEQRSTYTSIGGTPFLDGEYTVFGEVIEGLDVVDKIASVPTSTGNKPIKDIKMTIKVL